MNKPVDIKNRRLRRALRLNQLDVAETLGRQRRRVKCYWLVSALWAIVAVQFAIIAFLLANR